MDMGKEPTIGFTLICPGCGKDETYFSATYQSWVCQRKICGKTFNLEDTKKEEKEDG